jgi:hypothetical protein
MSQRWQDNHASYAVAAIKSSRRSFGSFNSEEFELECKNDKILSAAWRKAKEECGHSDLQRIALYCYSLETPRFYAKLNEALRDLFDGKLSDDKFPYKNFCKLLEESIQKFGKEYETLYRGILHIKDISKWRVGDNIFANQFESCSLYEDVARGFAGNGTLFIIKNAPYGIVIGEYGKFADEKEVIIPPNYEFKITDIKIKQNSKSPNIVTMKW